ncbi:uncharacterized protein [Rhodnius prolixus]|uniref:uncharacterized protein n=1 Tax=Rhodnius prolixus TaxID=13249 RepID=UPI003D188800
MAGFIGCCIFNGGKLAKNERWFFNREKIEVVNNYNYLGITLSSKLTFHSHLKEKLSKAKQGINTLWKYLIETNNVEYNSKLRFFNAVSRSIVCYGAQVWGGVYYDELEKLFRFFVERLFRLPMFVPMAFIYNELGYLPIFTHTFKLHCNYILKVFNMPDSRLPKLVAKHIVEKQLYWFKAILKLMDQCELNLEINLSNINRWSDIFGRLQNRISLNFKAQIANKVIEHDSYPLYRALKFDLGNNHYLRCNLPLEHTRWLMKARVGILKLGSSAPYQRVENDTCQLCNDIVTDGVYHFIASCPRLSDIRLGYFGQLQLSGEEALAYMNGRNWVSTVSYIKAAYVHVLNYS